MPAPHFVLQDSQTVVMIGDSITDAGHLGPHAPLGHGYVSMAAAFSAAKYPRRHLRFINSGISGNRIVDLINRWEADVLAHRPDWLSVSIGINDVWRQMDKTAPGVAIEEYTAVYRDLLERTRAAVSGCGLILMTPGLIGEQADSEGNRLLAPYVRAVEQLAAKFNAFCVPIHAAMLQAIGDGRTWTTDGVHPRPEGHALMALTWLTTLGW